MLHLAHPFGQLGQAVGVHGQYTKGKQAPRILRQLSDLVTTEVKDLEIGHVGDALWKVSKVVGANVEVSEAVKVGKVVG